MSPEDLLSEERAASAVSADRVTLSKWVNERFPAWEQLLSAHDVARLTRRPRWVLLGLSLLGRFPRKHCVRGRRIWLRADVLDWIGSRAGFNGNGAPLSRPRIARPDRPEVCAARRSRTACSLRRARGW